MLLSLQKGFLDSTDVKYELRELECHSRDLKPQVCHRSPHTWLLSPLDILALGHQLQCQVGLPGRTALFTTLPAPLSPRGSQCCVKSIPCLSNAKTSSCIYRWSFSDPTMCFRVSLESLLIRVRIGPSQGFQAFSQNWLCIDKKNLSQDSQALPVGIIKHSYEFPDASPPGPSGSDPTDLWSWVCGTFKTSKTKIYRQNNS